MRTIFTVTGKDYILLLFKFLENDAFQELHRNIMICILKYAPPFFTEKILPDLQNTQMQKQLLEMKDILEKENPTADKKISVAPTYSYIPNLVDLIKK